MGHAGRAPHRLAIPSIDTRRRPGSPSSCSPAPPPGSACARFALGLGEAGNFPAAIKTVAEWFPQKERALATGIFNAGTNVGAIVTPLVVPWITLHVGLAVGVHRHRRSSASCGWLWWLASIARREQHPRLEPGELAYIRSDPAEAVHARPLGAPARPPADLGLRDRQVPDRSDLVVLPVLVPDFLNREHGLNLDELGPPLIVIYLMADVGSIGGGWLSSRADQARLDGERRAQDGDAHLRAVRGADLFAPQVREPVGGGRLIGLAAAAHQGWSREPLHARRPTCSRAAPSAPWSGIGGHGGRGRRDVHLDRRRARSCSAPAAITSDLLHRRLRPTSPRWPSSTSSSQLDRRSPTGDVGA